MSNTHYQGSSMIAGKFYSEQLGCSIELGERIDRFMMLAHGLKAVENPKLWAHEGMARVYFTLWSQNKRNPIEQLDKSYFDAESDDVWLQLYFFGYTKKVRLKDIFKTFGKSYFSGAKTREAIEEFIKVFYG